MERRVGEGTEGTWALPGSLGRSACHHCSRDVAVTQQRAVDIKTPIYSLQCADPAAASAHCSLSSQFSPFLSSSSSSPDWNFPDFPAVPLPQHLVLCS